MDQITSIPERKITLTPVGTAKTLYFSLEPEAEVAVLARMLNREGYNDHNWGHITYVQPDGTILLTPWEKAWDEMRASDILRMDEHGKLLNGQWSVTPAIELHLAVHRLRPDIKVAVHNHTEWGTVWSTLGEVPEVYNQSSAGVGGELALYNDYEGDVTYDDIAEANVRAMGDNVAAILAHHGVFVLADSIKRAHQRCVSLEQRCEMAWKVKALGEGKGRPMSPSAVDLLVKANLGDKAGDRFYHAMIRREILHDASVLT
jgi:ribulose-5-phosphate 4-epimerase/fuculose-1-phosphate aldolase